MVCQKDHVLCVGDDAFLERRLPGVAFTNTAVEMQAVSGKEHAVNVVALQGFLGGQADERPRLRVEQPAGADQIEVRSVRQRAEDIQRVGENREREVRQEFGERQDRGARIEEDRFVRANPACCDPGNCLFLLPPDGLALGEWQFLADFVWPTGPAVSPDEFSAFLQSLEIFAHRFIRHPKFQGGVGGAQGTRPVEEIQNPALAVDGEHDWAFSLFAWE